MIKKTFTILTILAVAWLMIVPYQTKAVNTYSLNLVAASSQSASITDGAQTGLDLSGGTDKSIECWVNFASLPTAQQTFLSKSLSTGNQRGYAFTTNVSGGKYYLYFWNSADGGNVNRDIFTSSTDYAFVAGSWYYVAATWASSTPAVNFYVGTRQNAPTKLGNTINGAQTTTFNNSANFAIGADQGNISDYLDGKIDECRVWADKVLTLAEIQVNYQTQIDTATGLVGSWHFDNDLLDATANNNDLTNNNVATFSTEVPYPFATAGEKQGQIIFFES